MRKRNRSDAGDRSEITELSLLKEMTRLLRILVRVNLSALRGDRSQTDMIVLLHSLGCGHADIADLLGVKSNSVGPALSRAKKKK